MPGGVRVGLRPAQTQPTPPNVLSRFPQRIGSKHLTPRPRLDVRIDIGSPYVSCGCCLVVGRVFSVCGLQKIQGA